MTQLAKSENMSVSDIAEILRISILSQLVSSKLPRSKFESGHGILGRILCRNFQQSDSSETNNPTEHWRHSATHENIYRGLKSPTEIKWFPAFLPFQKVSGKAAHYFFSSFIISLFVKFYFNLLSFFFSFLSFAKLLICFNQHEPRNYLQHLRFFWTVSSPCVTRTDFPRTL